MILETLEVIHFGKLKKVNLNFNKKLNIFVGKNASGKSKFLDLIMRLCDCDFYRIVSSKHNRSDVNLIASFCNPNDFTHKMSVHLILKNNENLIETSSIVTNQNESTKVSQKGETSEYSIEITLYGGLKELKIVIKNNVISFEQDNRFSEISFFSLESGDLFHYLRSFFLNPVKDDNLNLMRELILETLDSYIQKPIAIANRLKFFTPESHHEWNIVEHIPSDDLINEMSDFEYIIKIRFENNKVLETSRNVQLNGLSSIFSSLMSKNENLEFLLKTSNNLNNFLKTVEEQLLIESDSLKGFLTLSRFKSISCEVFHFEFNDVKNKFNKSIRLKAKIKLRDSDGELFDFNELTPGEKRLFEICLMLCQNFSSTSFVDEIENNLHPEWIKFIIYKFVDCGYQSFFVTHNPYVLDTAYGSINEEAFLTTSLVHIFKNEMGMHVSSLSEQVLEDMVKMLDNSFEQPSQYLINRGLW